MMGKQDFRATVLHGAIREELVAGISSSRFHRFTGLLHPGPNITAPDFTLAAQFLRQFQNKSSIRRRGPATQAVIEMANHQIPETGPYQQVQQSHRIRPT